LIVIKDDPEVLPMFHKAMNEQGKRNDLCNNITEVKGQVTGTSKAYTLTRLQKDKFGIPPKWRNSKRPESRKNQFRQSGGIESANQLTQSVLCEPRRTPR
jgi:hypothetical protein